MSGHVSKELPFKALFGEFIRASLKARSVDDVLADLAVALRALELDNNPDSIAAVGEIVKTQAFKRIADFHPDEHGDERLKQIEQIAHDARRRTRR